MEGVAKEKFFKLTFEYDWINSLVVLGNLLKIYIPVYYSPFCATDRDLCQIIFIP